MVKIEDLENKYTEAIIRIENLYDDENKRLEHEKLEKLMGRWGSYELTNEEVFGELQKYCDVLRRVVNER